MGSPATSTEEYATAVPVATAAPEVDPAAEFRDTADNYPTTPVDRVIAAARVVAEIHFADENVNQLVRALESALKELDAATTGGN